MVTGEAFPGIQGWIRQGIPQCWVDPSRDPPWPHREREWEWEWERETKQGHNFRRQPHALLNRLLGQRRLQTDGLDKPRLEIGFRRSHRPSLRNSDRSEKKRTFIQLAGKRTVEIGREAFGEILAVGFYTVAADFLSDGQVFGAACHMRNGRIRVVETRPV